MESLSYGWKVQKDPLCVNITTNCAYSGLCCSYDQSDTLKHFTQYQTFAVYQQCSGKRRREDVRATSTYLDPLVPNIETLSTYVVLVIPVNEVSEIVCYVDLRFC